MSDVAKLIEKLGLSIVGEQPNLVLEVLAAFTRTLLDRWGVSVEDYVEAMRMSTPVVRPVARRRDPD